ncbi:hypothetical protein P3T76_000037 [Phytophthora citrophthora]|uniref:Uncharacterized protein n=1 Tax=Phytophthora citrophthora TaxID=4793 RepID=A0AAD9GZR0_9STRA|nr:hypothetical protein P3T76_000037 [Phytophthora citrophthora]
MPTNPVLLQRIESGVSNLFDNLGFRLRQHAEGVQHPDNRSMLSEMVEMVYTDWQRDTVYTLLIGFMERLNAARMWAEDLVRVIDAKRERDIERQENYLRGEYDRTDLLRDHIYLDSVDVPDSASEFREVGAIRWIQLCLSSWVDVC